MHRLVQGADTLTALWRRAATIGRRFPPGSVPSHFWTLLQIEVLLDGTHGISVNRRTRIRDQERAPIGSGPRARKQWTVLKTFAHTADVCEAHRRPPLDEVAGENGAHSQVGTLLGLRVPNPQGGVEFRAIQKGLGSKKPSIHHVALRPTDWNTGWRSQFHTPTLAPAPQTRQGDGRRFTDPARMVSPNKHARATRYTDWTKCTDCFFSMI